MFFNFLKQPLGTMFFINGTLQERLYLIKLFSLSGVGDRAAVGVDCLTSYKFTKPTCII